MKQFIIFIFSICLTNSLYSQDQFICKDGSHLHEIEADNHQGLMDFKRNPYTQNYDINYHRLEWDIDPAEFYIKGKVTTYFTPTETAFNQINFDFLSNMTINKIRYHDNLVTHSFIGTDILQIDLPNFISMGTVDSISIEYEGIPQSPGFGSFETNTHGPNDTPVMWTLSEPYGAKTWWPCKQDLIDKIDSIDIYVKTPSIYRAASNGVLKSENVSGDNTTYHWSHRHAIPAYLIAIAVTDYEVFSDYVILDNGDSIEILNYIYPESRAAAESQVENTIEIMELYNGKFGIYPFADEKYGHAQFGWGGGMEHQTMSFMGGFSYGLQAHELAHQWFGDKITCGSWEDIWLNEGFATYLTGLTNEFLKSENDWNNWKKGKISSITNNPSGSVWVDDTTSVSRIFNSRLSYNKGSYVLHMLRWKLGDEDFFQACKNYITDPNLSFSYARTSDLKAHMEAMLGEDLTEYFNDWFYNQGYPSYQVSWAIESDGVTFTIGQTTSHNSVDFFEMPIPIHVKGEGQDSILILDHQYTNQSFDIALPFEVTEVVFDPEKWLISKNNTIEKVISGNSDLTDQNNLVVSPNPFNDKIHINSSEQPIESIEIIDMLGRVIFNSEPLLKSLDINTANWEHGNYLLKIQYKYNTTTRILVK